MLLNKTDLNTLTSVTKYTRTTIKTESVMVESRLDSIIIYYRYKSPTNAKIRIKKLGAFAYGSISAKDITNIRNEVTTLKALVIKGRDPLDTKRELKAKRLQELTHPQLWETYINSLPYAKKADQTKVAYNNSAKKILNHFKNKSLNMLTKKDLQDFVYSLSAGTGKLVVAVLNILEAIYVDSQTDSTGMISTRAYKLKHLPMKRRTRTMTEEQIKDLFTHDGTIGLICRFQLYYALRLGEVINARWSWVDFEKMTFTVPPEFIKTERASKNDDRPHVLPLTETVIKLLLQLGDRNDKDSLIFKNSFNKPINITRVNYWLRRYEISSHDIRRTAGSWVSANSVVPDALTILLNHKKSTGSDASYDHSQYIGKKKLILGVLHSFLDELTMS